jgi:hypothetical protein
VLPALVDVLKPKLRVAGGCAVSCCGYRQPPWDYDIKNDARYDRGSTFA